jgi:hypothetical protein
MDLIIHDYEPALPPHYILDYGCEIEIKGGCEQLICAKITRKTEENRGEQRGQTNLAHDTA